MLRQEVNDLLTQTGLGTPMGALFRRYWLPAMLAEELPENDCPPVRVKLLSERLIAFRDTGGRYGLIDEFCPHRGVSLWFGRNEEHGLRCPYHGWKFDVDGQCLEVPSEPEDSRFCEKIRLTSYPLVKIGDVLWAYMGPEEHQPAAAGVGVRARAGVAQLHVQAPAGMQLAAGAGRRHRFQPRLLAARRGRQERPAVPQRAGQQVQSRRQPAGLRGGRESRAAC